MHKSASLDSLNLQTISTTSVLTSTTNPEVKPSSFSKLARRFAIIPTPNRPVRLSTAAKIQSCIKEDISMMNTVVDTDKNDDSDANNHILLGSKQNSSELLNIVDNQSNQEDHDKDDQDEDNLFDTFICSNFVPFTGKQSIDQWLDETEILFNRFKISRKLRFKAVPLLIQGEAKRKYIRNRRSITSFDDFYEFLITHFDTVPSVSSISKPSSVDNTLESTKSSVCVNKSINEFKSKDVSSNDSTQVSQSRIYHSNNIVGNDTTKVYGDVSDLKSSVNTSSNDTLPLDSVIPDLRKAIVADFIKNPKIFRGNKDDVSKWLEEIDHLMEIAHVPDCNRLDLISYSLRGDALQWFRNNKSTLTSWTIFIQDIKKAFTSTFCEELAFKTLESYTQGEHQSVRNFYNEVLKLCKQADASMSESTKLKNLLNKVKPSIQLEVRKNKPKSTTEFLEYAKEVEELLQLSRDNNDTDINYDSKSKNSTKLANTSNSFSSNYASNSNNDYSSTPQRSWRNNSASSSFTSYPSYVSKPDRAQTSSSNYYSNSNRYMSSTNKNNNSYNNYKQKNTQQYKHAPKHNNKTNSHLVNAVFSSSLPAQDDAINNSISSAICQICNELGHDASSCPSFQ